MEYREVYRQICKYAADHLYSLDVYDEFDVGDEDRVDKAIGELQNLLYRKSEGRRYLGSRRLLDRALKAEQAQQQGA